VKFPGNCLVVSMAMACAPGSRLRTKRNRMGRLHFYWQTSDGRTWEFYKRGASGKNYLQNALYVGEIKEVR
jgi:hypothetical protein